ncbi:MAG TPA: hypothetical protein DIS79_01990 [Bacteroidetes bacterium]|nr:hypothetical protein [Bacteroidota bacterium]
MLSVILSLFVVLCGSGVFCMAAQSEDVRQLDEFNTSGTDLAVAFRTVNGVMEAWVTTNDGAPDARGRRIVRYVRGNDGRFSQAELDPVFTGPSTHDGIAQDGCVTFAACDPNVAIFVSNRRVEGQAASNDLYEARFRNGSWSITRIESLSTAAWEDQPALSADGNILYFVSDRHNPNGRKTDIYVARRTQEGWSIPEPLAFCTAERNEQTPCPTPDGKLLYAIDAPDAQRIYDLRVVDVDKNGRALDGAPSAPLPATVTTASEGHPSFTPGGRWLIFTSNREGAKGFDLFAMRWQRDSVVIDLTTVFRGRRGDAVGGGSEDYTMPLGNVDIDVRYLPSESSSKLIVDKDGHTSLSMALDNGPLDDVAEIKIELAIDVTDPRHVGPTDTLLLGRGCTGRFAHTLVVYDTSAWYTSECIQDFPTKNVRFFVTGYWCPTTLKYGNDLTCTSVFAFDECTKVEHPEPELACGRNEIYSYSMVYEAPKVAVARRPGVCVDMNEARQKGPLFASEVDAAIDRILESMRSALRVPCVLREVERGKKITVDVIGWTDPRALDPKCVYTGPDVQLDQRSVSLDITDSPYAEDGTIDGEGKTKFSVSKAGGNQLLSQLRALHAAEMLDRIWTRTLPEYKALRDKDLIRVVAIGKAVSQDAVSNDQRRSVEVRVTVPVTATERQQGLVAPPGGTYRLCDGVGCR